MTTRQKKHKRSKFENDFKFDNLEDISDRNQDEYIPELETKHWKLINTMDLHK